MTYRIDHHRLQRVAEDHWGIIGPVVLRRRQRSSLGINRCWQHGFPDGDNYVEHRITVDPRRTAAQIARTIAHELTHAEQAEWVLLNTTERDCFQALEDEAKRQHKLPYLSRPWEVEARQVADRRTGLVLRECIR